MPVKRPVLVMGWLTRVTVAIARSLHRRGLAVDLADFIQSPRIHSRAVRRWVQLPNPNSSPERFVAELRRLVADEGHDMLVPADDLAIAAITEHYDELKNILQIACPPPPVTRSILNKALTLQIAEKCGIRIPKTTLIHNSSELLDRANTFTFPCVMKPAEKDTRLEEVKSYKFSGSEEMKAVFPVRREFRPPMLLQEYCPGFGLGIEMLVHEGECLVAFQHRRLKELPYTGGMSVTALAEHPDPKLVTMAFKLLRALNWEGVAMVEFKVNAENMEPVLMEVNGRYWGTISLPISAGIDFPWYHWQVLHGEYPTVPSGYSVNMKWRWTVGYLFRLHGMLVHSRNNPDARKALVHNLLHLLEDFGPSTSDALFAPSDPTPAFLDIWRAVKYFVTSDLKATLKRLSAQRR